MCALELPFLQIYYDTHHICRIGLFAAVAIAKSLEFAFTPEGMLKLGESRPGIVKGKAKDKSNTNNFTPNGHANLDSDTPHPYIAPWLGDAFELAHSLRGLRWKFGQGAYIPPDPRPLSPPSAFLRSTAITFIKHYLTLDLIESCLKLFPGSISTPLGGSIFYSSLPPFQRYAVATLIHTLTGTAILEGFGMVYDLVTLIAVGLFRSDPTSWPPIIDAPWRASSMHDLWARRWHQLLRRTFLIFGGYPGRFFTFGSDIGLIFGAFIASGLFHECAMYAMRRGYDHSATIFFAMQGPVLLGERLWRKVTGRRVGGWAGRLWVYFMMLIVAQPMVDAWHRRGLAGGRVIPPTLSPVRQILFPVIRKLWELSPLSRS